MLSYQEVRVGNYALLNNEIKMITLVNNHDGYAELPRIGFLCQEDSFRSYQCENVEPITLTDDILKQCGFVFHPYLQFWQLISFDSGIRTEMDIDQDYNLVDFLRRPIVKKIKYLHQLQNIYFALKGSEIRFEPSFIKDDPIAIKIVVKELVQA